MVKTVLPFLVLNSSPLMEPRPTPIKTVTGMYVPSGLFKIYKEAFSLIDLLARKETFLLHLFY
jgi:hypothetical protein